MRVGRHIHLSVDERDIRAWIGQMHPVILVIFDAQNDRAYWIHIQAYFRSVDPDTGPNIRMYRTIRIPVKNRMNRSAMMNFAEEKNMIYH